jgi:O-antigen ligase
MMLPGVSRRVSYLVVTIAIGLFVSNSFATLQQRALFRIEKTLNANTSMRSRTSGRSDLMLGGWYIVQENPLGIGTGGFAIAWSNLGMRPGLSSFKQSSSFQAHSGWLKVLTENGILGLLFLAAYVSSFAFCGWRRPIAGARGLGLYVTTILAVAFFPTEFQCKGLWFLAAGGATFLQPAALARAIQPHRQIGRMVMTRPRLSKEAHA